MALSRADGVLVPRPRTRSLKRPLHGCKAPGSGSQSSADAPAGGEKPSVKTLPSFLWVDPGGLGAACRGLSPTVTLWTPL